jgi:glyceraldehyde-3-phosphate dehydrogenase (NADP+)
MFEKKPFVDGKKVLCSGVIKPYTGEAKDVCSPIVDNNKQKTVIGRLAQMTGNDVSEVLHSSKCAWNKGLGQWPLMSGQERIKALKNFITSLKEKREEIIHVLMWEIGKSTEDAQYEFDRTIKFMDETICEYQRIDQKKGSLKDENGFIFQTKRGPIGIVLSLGPYNYPLNESYTTIFPALLTGNVVIFKLPSLGGLAHVHAMEAFAKHLPAGVMNFVSGSGRDLVGPVMNSGIVDVLSFIGGAKAADAILKEHPEPHRLHTFLQLESKDLGIVLPDADLETTIPQLTTGATSYNGQRCTTIKLIFVHKSLVDDFLQRFSEKVSSLKWGQPWEQGVKITPLPEQDKVKEMCALIEDAVNKGAKLINEKEGGGEVHDSLIRPAILFPVNDTMRLWNEEQFGPVIPVAVYDDLNEVIDYLARSPYGQQASVFTQQARTAAPLVDVLANIVCRININTQCGRQPDTLPFTGRRSSALGTMSVRDALKEFSVDVVIAAKDDEVNGKVLNDLQDECKFLQPLEMGTGTDMSMSMSKGQGQGQTQGKGTQYQQQGKEGQQFQKEQSQHQQQRFGSQQQKYGTTK